MITMNPINRRTFIQTTLLCAASLAASTHPITRPRHIRVRLASGGLWVVDSERDVATSVELLAQHAGIAHIRAFRSKHEALRCLQAAATKPRILVTDYLGGEMKGREFIPIARKLSPGTIIILFSAVIADERAWVGAAGPNVAQPDVVICKPDVAALLQCFS
jgi:hypothetical protein